MYSTETIDSALWHVFHALERVKDVWCDDSAVNTGALLGLALKLSPVFDSGYDRGAARGKFSGSSFEPKAVCSIP